jgi:hypothetical protein
VNHKITNLTEAIITNADAEALFKDAANLRSKSSGLGKLFPGLRKEKIELEDLRKAWANGLEGDGSDGYSNDTHDIKQILLKFGFGEKEINKVFAEVFKSDKTGYDEIQDAPAGSKAVQKVADLAKKHGLTKQLKAFLEQEFAEDLRIDKKKVTTEEIKKLFNEMLHENRSERMKLIGIQENSYLGRQRKSSRDVDEDLKVSLSDVINSASFIKLMGSIKAKPQDLHVTKIKNQVLKSWKNGMRSRKHYDSLLGQLNISLNQIIGE